MKTKVNSVCRGCGAALNDENWTAGQRRARNPICKSCHNKQMQQWRKAHPEYCKQWQKANPDKMKAASTREHRKQGHLPFNENRECTAYLGVYVAERVLSHVFKNVKRMPYGNPGYDIICNHNKRIDIKSACKQKDRSKWQFNINHNKIADCFLCLAFDNREDLNPLHVWLIPGDVINSRGSVGISPNTVSTWDKYALDISKVTACCNIMRGDK